MSAGFPLFVFSVLAAIILVVWLRNGIGSKSIRVKVTSVFLLLMSASWLTLLSFGVFHPVGSWGMGVGFVVSIAAFFVPIVYNRMSRNEKT